ncbi:hypothetical protein, unlikely [Trypanosoma brucei gambiense DAL972]|uniref:Uncharacterized protein n=1 Tax=Trypanosoma brucei gambiense (strain MHOM/CI/86/DAL972) TaxID=679716 RepID=D0A1S6_TRYB9|nr:hypothetical protein, unlikely [Trypanosoma brucei gambiense DAL972]CBH15219.1 hypothetical protein, unlikely [Trypanosoma brucei gambiense DAL972]|eukprot:XP_011777484.1 hypothetical protein, unlikely [Trypanosoma brucei gambiense DAL972]
MYCGEKLTRDTSSLWIKVNIHVSTHTFFSCICPCRFPFYWVIIGNSFGWTLCRCVYVLLIMLLERCSRVCWFTFALHVGFTEKSGLWGIQHLAFYSFALPTFQGNVVLLLDHLL